MFISPSVVEVCRPGALDSGTLMRVLLPLCCELLSAINLVYLLLHSDGVQKFQDWVSNVLHYTVFFLALLTVMLLANQVSPLLSTRPQYRHSREEVLPNDLSLSD